ncbi:MAG TPA: type IX secretion system membrane protein PorP/SprF [Flavobacterium sp.]|jgi:type IX secretion system PorP/SprF family membrane protein
MKNLILLVVIMVSGAKAWAQQDPQYTQYMYNMNVINPAYATDGAPILNVGSLYRTQWVGAEGAPKTLSVFAHMPMTKKVQVGLSLQSDQIGNGAKKEHNFYGDFAYVLQLKEERRLSFGLKAGFTSLATNFNGFMFESGDNQTDLAFQRNINLIAPNIGAGVFYFTDKYYVGVSAPNLLSSKHIEERNGINAYGSEYIHAFLTGGYVFALSPALKFKPAFMVKAVKGAPTSIDITANVLYNNKVEFGIAYRVDDSVSGLVNFNITPDLRLGYAYDYTTSNLGQFNSGSHELMLLLDFYMLGKKKDKSPRFF